MSPHSPRNEGFFRSARQADELADLRIDGARLHHKIASLAAIGGLEGGGVSRLALTDADRAGRDQVVRWMKELDLEVSVDRIGNVVAVQAGASSLAPVVSGSHIDTVQAGGAFDGNLGVLAALEVIATLNDAGLKTRRPLAVAFFTNEEGARFAPDMLGSAVQQGALDLGDALDRVDSSGLRLGDELERIGYAGPATPALAAHAFVE
ncbi:MAG TPA: M20/M25/M40 family metallo-hydrolase, partial [Nannocystis exedens]|nr:M20/M25/M40 family metallo-hydrolase [Nannocystis exedens]